MVSQSSGAFSEGLFYWLLALDRSRALDKSLALTLVADL